MNGKDGFDLRCVEVVECRPRPELEMFSFNKPANQTNTFGTFGAQPQSKNRALRLSTET
jgi:hypothetical protein